LGPACPGRIPRLFHGLQLLAPSADLLPPVAKGRRHPLVIGIAGAAVVGAAYPGAGRWPVYYTNSVNVITDLNLWQPTGELADDYLA